MYVVADTLIFLFIASVTIALWRRSRVAKPLVKLEDAEPCEYCGYDTRATPERCPECGHETPLVRTRRLRRLREEWPANPINIRIPRSDESPHLLFTSFSVPLADLLRQHLECRGVTCQLSRAEGGISPTTGAPLIGAWRLLVWSDDVDVATAIVKHLLPEEEQAGLEQQPEASVS